MERIQAHQELLAKYVFTTYRRNLTPAERLAELVGVLRASGRKVANIDDLRDAGIKSAEIDEHRFDEACQLLEGGLLAFREQAAARVVRDTPGLTIRRCSRCDSPLSTPPACSSCGRGILLFWLLLPFQIALLPVGIVLGLMGSRRRFRRSIEPLVVMVAGLATAYAVTLLVHPMIVLVGGAGFLVLVHVAARRGYRRSWPHG